MRIAEIYQSIQGEGRFTGEPSVFVRASGCNLRCWFCDTPHASWRPEGDDLDVETVLAEVLKQPAEHVVITGGEPLLWSEMVPLTLRLKAAGKRITIETAGTLHLPVVCDLMSISPKLANSTPTAEQANGWAARHERTRQSVAVTRRLADEYPCQLKFVIDQPDDILEVETYLAEFGRVAPESVWLMPQGTTTAELTEREPWLAAACRERGFHYCPRKHIEWFGLTRGT